MLHTDSYGILKDMIKVLENRLYKISVILVQGGQKNYPVKKYFCFANDNL